MIKIKDVVDTLENLSVYRGRYKDGKRDLMKAVEASKPVTKVQKEEIMDYWKPFLNDRLSKRAFDFRWFDVYNRTNVFGFDLKHYIPDSYYYAIIDTFFSNARKSKSLDDKNLYDLYFPDAPMPRTIVHKANGIYLDEKYKMLSEYEAVERCYDASKVIVKKSLESSGGHGVFVWDKNSADMDNLREVLSRNQSMVVQDFVKQHEVLSSFNNTCVNTIRMVTLCFEGEIHLVTSVVIMGGKDAVTNHLHSGGLVCGVLHDGQLRKTAFDGKLNQYDAHPNGIRFVDTKLPNYDKCVDLVKKLAPRFVETSKLISWDLTIDCEANPVLIETNLAWGGSVQIAGGPVFGDLTDKVLEYVRINRKRCF